MSTTEKKNRRARRYHCPLEQQPDGAFLCPDCKRPATRFTHRKCSAVEEPKRVDLSVLLMSCQHGAGLARIARCPTCYGDIKIKVFRCALHGGECDVTGKFLELRQCASCPDFEPSDPSS